MNTPPTITVFISGGGSNLAALIRAVQTGELNAHINAVIADRDCLGKEHAFAANIPFVMIDRKLPKGLFTQRLLAAIPKKTDLIVLAGFLSIIPQKMIHSYPQKIINLHPSLLPKYGGMGMYGMRVHQAVINAHEKISGCSVHYVDEGIDSGEIIAQASVPVYKDDTPEALQQRIQAQEHPLLIHTIKDILCV